MQKKVCVSLIVASRYFLRNIRVRLSRLVDGKVCAKTVIDELEDYEGWYVAVVCLVFERQITKYI